MPTPSSPILTTTSRLYISLLDPTNPRHSTFLFHCWTTPDFTTSCGPSAFKTPADATQFLTTRVQTLYNTSNYTRGIFLLSLRPHPAATLQESVPIGTMSLMQGTPPDGYLCPDLGFVVLPEQSGRGYATEAGRALVAYACEELGVAGVFGFCEMGNARSRRVLEKIGLEFRGEKELRVFGGKRSAVYALSGMERDLRIYGVDD
ncbi:GNAT family N-acetyltransferase [Aspergillus saccharolyticus JOP 1030-1]|uniref:Putative GNAT family acetyltransferase n=1 Tax=Aspergillus saccharolyticus JOP 1030-1 TaxID=1450539 RepID=A0A319ACJ6_9EURO|nr:putative GNAT family acetyltransferase [Aspergillus saccharolyticus JOP 1030-1]PYH49368.1 putative GNAT family acetyltransferase [Aspergillus saccharolyticus JOP 1030-1]